MIGILTHNHTVPNQSKQLAVLFAGAFLLYSTISCKECSYYKYDVWNTAINNRNQNYSHEYHDKNFLLNWNYSDSPSGCCSAVADPTPMNLQSSHKSADLKMQ